MIYCDKVKLFCNIENEKLELLADVYYKATYILYNIKDGYLSLSWKRVQYC